MASIYITINCHVCMYIYMSETMNNQKKKKTVYNNYLKNDIIKNSYFMRCFQFFIFEKDN